jgi:hypothetical protein
MSNKEQTAVEWLLDELNNQKCWIYPIKCTNLFTQAKEMERQQMGYTKEDVLMAGFIGEINHFDTEHIVSLLDEAKQYNETHGDK